MIISIRGTGGSGKSTLVRHVMARYPAVSPMHQLGRQRPLGYKCTRPDGPTLVVPGHYETACGGCDTIGTPGEAFDIINMAVEAGSDVLFEGIIVQDDTKRIIALHAAGVPVRVVALMVTTEECLASIQARRDARGDARPLNPKNTVNRAYRLEGSMKKLMAAGLDAQWLGRQEALAFVLDILHLTPGTGAGADGGPAVAVQGQAAGQEARRGETLFDFDD